MFIPNVANFYENSKVLRIQNLDTPQKFTYGRIYLHIIYSLSTQCRSCILWIRITIFQKIQLQNILKMFGNLISFLKRALSIYLSKIIKIEIKLCFSSNHVSP